MYKIDCMADYECPKCKRRIFVKPDNLENGQPLPKIMCYEPHEGQRMVVVD